MQGDSLGGGRYSTVSTFEFNEDGFERAVQAAAQPKVKGRPVAVVKPALRRAWERDGRTITDPELTEYAAYISEGTPIRFEA
jgi:hypothetical protein